MKFNEKVVIITGSANGIGSEIGTAFAKAGAKVVLTDLDVSGAKKAENQLREQGYECMSTGCDVANEEDIKKVIDLTMDHYGRLDILINNAGLQFIAPIEEFPTERFEQLIRVMLIAPFVATKMVFPIMKKQQFGRIINMASINGLIGFSGKAAYNSAKHGVIGLTKVAALEGAADGITVNAICPGYVDTPLVRNQLEGLAKNRQVPLESVLEEVIYPLVPQRRLLDVEEITNYVLFLAGEEAKGVTGQAVVIDGGYVAQ